MKSVSINSPKSKKFTVRLKDDNIFLTADHHIKINGMMQSSRITSGDQNMRYLNSCKMFIDKNYIDEKFGEESLPYKKYRSTFGNFAECK